MSISTAGGELARREIVGRLLRVAERALSGLWASHIGLALLTPEQARLLAAAARALRDLVEALRSRR